MKISSRIIARLLMLCGIALACTACYAPPRAGFIPPGDDTGVEEAAAEGATADRKPAAEAAADAVSEEFENID